METNRRAKGRRYSDRILEKTVEILRILERTSRGEQADFTEAYADLVGLKDQLGRRREDHKLADALSAIIESLAGNISRSLQTRTPRRKIKLVKVSGTRGVKKTVVGWEEEPPLVGKSYRVRKENGEIIRTSLVTNVAAGYVRTKHSLYHIDILEEEP